MKYLRLRHIIIFAFLIRIFFAILAYHNAGDTAIFHRMDSKTYIAPATSILETGYFAIAGAPELHRTPLYPLILIPGIALGEVELITILIQIILSCFTVALVYLSSFIIFGNRKAALMGAAFYSLEPLSLNYSALILTETAFAFFIMLFLYFMLLYLDRRHFQHLIFSAVALTASVYTRPISYFLPLFISFGIFSYIFIRGKSLTDAIVHSFLFVLLCMVFILPWQIRNYSLTGYKGFCTISDSNLYDYHAASIMSVKNNVPFQEQQRIFAEEAVKHEPDVVEKYGYMHRVGKKIIGENKKEFVKLYVRGIVAVLLEPGTTDFNRMIENESNLPGLIGIILSSENRQEKIAALLGSPASIFSLLYTTIPLYFPLLLGIVAVISPGSGAMRNTLLLIIVLMVVFYFVALSGGITGYARFRHPIMPFMCLLAGCGLFRFSRKGFR